MSLPGFTAEVSAYKTSNTYYGTSSTFTSAGSGAVFLQQSSCEEQCRQTLNRCRSRCDIQFDICRQSCPPPCDPGPICSVLPGAPPCCSGRCEPLGIGGLGFCTG